MSWILSHDFLNLKVVECYWNEYLEEERAVPKYHLINHKTDDLNLGTDCISSLVWFRKTLELESED